MPFLGIILWKGVSRFNGEGLFFRWGASFLSGGGAPWGALLDGGRGGFLKKIIGWGHPHVSPHYGKPWGRGQAMRFVSKRFFQVVFSTIGFRVQG